MEKHAQHRRVVRLKPGARIGTRIGARLGVSLSAFLCLGMVDLTRAADITALKPLAVVSLGKTADWVAIGDDAVWVGSTGPDAVHRIDPVSNHRTATVLLPGEPCAGLALGFGSLWVPLCTKPSSLARVDLASNRLLATYPVGPAGAEGGVTAGADAIWLITNKHGTLARIDPESGRVTGTTKLAAGSYNPHFADGMVWVTQADGAALSGVDATTGKLKIHVQTHPGPRFLTVGGGAVWTLNQGDGTLTRYDLHAKVARHIALHTPGHGGDITFAADTIWTTMPKTPLSGIDAGSGEVLCQWHGAGGDSLGIGFDAIWLTDYRGGTVTRYALQDTLAACRAG